MSRDNSGSMSRNQRKEKSTHADYKGKCVIGGKEYWISGWKKENDNGPWLSLAFEPKVEKDRHHGGTTVEERSSRRDRDDW